MNEPPSYYRRFGRQREAPALKVLVSEKSKELAKKTPALKDEIEGKGSDFASKAFFLWPPPAQCSNLIEVEEAHRMKSLVKLLLLAGGLFLFPRAGNAIGAVKAAAIVYKSAEEILGAADTNYTRTTLTYLSAEAFASVLPHNRFDCFTQSRKTLWNTHALYMHNESTQINSGYLDKANALYHYTLRNGLQDIAKSDASLVENIRRDHVSGDSAFTLHDFFMGCHYFKANATSLAASFSPVEGKSGVYESSNASLFESFLFFCAPLYTNPEVVSGTPFLSFSKVEIVDLADGSYQYNLYANESEKLTQSNGLFAVATVSAIGTTSLPIIDAYLAL